MAGTRDHRGTRVDAVRHGVHDDSRHRRLPGWPRRAARWWTGGTGRIRQERKSYAETVVHPAVQIGEITNAIPRIHPRGPLPRKERINLVLAKRWLFQWLGRTIPGRAAIAAEDNQWWHVSLFDQAVVTDASQSGVRVRRRDKQKLTTLTRRMNKALKQFREKHRRCRSPTVRHFPI